MQTQHVFLSSTTNHLQRFGSDDGSSGWKWEKGGVGMGGKDSGKENIHHFKKLFRS